MGWFSPVKGSYPSLAQVDKTLPVQTGVTDIERGTVVAVAADEASADGVWKLPESSDKMLYVALQDYNDPAAGYAGTTFNPAGGVPRITGIDLAQDGEYETSVFDQSATYAVGDELYANASGQLTTSGSGTLVGYVTRAPQTRWVNNAIALPAGGTDPRIAIRTGAQLSVLRFKTAV